MTPGRPVILDERVTGEDEGPGRLRPDKLLIEWSISHSDLITVAWSGPCSLNWA